MPPAVAESPPESETEKRRRNLLLSIVGKSGPENPSESLTVRETVNNCFVPISVSWSRLKNPICPNFRKFSQRTRISCCPASVPALGRILISQGNFFLSHAPQGRDKMISSLSEILWDEIA